MKKFTTVLLAVGIATLFTACGNKDNKNVSKSISMVADVGTVNDKSFNQSAWEGLQEFKRKTGVDVYYLDSTQTSDYKTNLEKLTDNADDLIWGIGNTFADDILAIANANPASNYAIADYNYDGDIPGNVTAVGFKSQEPAFLVGYVAGKSTKTNSVGFVGGSPNPIIQQFQYGYEAGVQYAAKEIGKSIEVKCKYADTFSDSAKGKAIALNLYTVENCDIIFHAAGDTGKGVIEKAKELNKYVIGVDRDQSSEAPDNVLTSALKLVGKAVQNVCQKFINGENIGGQNFVFGIKEGCAGIPDTNKNINSEVYADTMKVQDKIISGELEVPSTKNGYEAFVNAL